MKPADLTPAQVRALKQRQTAMFGPEAVFGRGTTLAALRRRGIIIGRQPQAVLTPAGEKLCQQIEKQDRPSRVHVHERKNQEKQQ